MRVKGGSMGGGREEAVGGERSYTSNRSTPRDTHWQILDDVLAWRTKRRHGNRLFFFLFFFFHYFLNSLFFFSLLKLNGIDNESLMRRLFPMGRREDNTSCN
jgi:hypothetical protein